MLAALPVGGFLMLFQIGMFAVNGWIAGTIWLILQLAVTLAIVVSVRTARRARRNSEIAARAHYEHRALLNGNDRLGVFGQFPPSC